MEILNCIHLNLNYNYITNPAETYIVDISGVDSVAALVNVLSAEDVAVVPTFVDVACEYGDKYAEFTRISKELSSAFNVDRQRILPSIIINVNELWRRVVSSSIQATFKKAGFYTPCIGCHLSFHLARIKVAQQLKVKGVVSGERELHGQKEKVNQLDFVLEFFNRLYTAERVVHVQPVRHVTDSQLLRDLVCRFGISPVDLKCLFSGNYYKVGTSTLDIEKDKIPVYLQFLETLLNQQQSPIILDCSTVGNEVNSGPGGRC